MQRFFTILVLLVGMATTVFAAGPDEAGVKSVIQRFQQAGRGFTVVLRLDREIELERIERFSNG